MLPWDSHVILLHALQSHVYVFRTVYITYKFEFLLVAYCTIFFFIYKLITEQFDLKNVMTSQR